MKRSSGWNQEVTDAQGRRRFHGAFTGGFSAGHFNTVGTEEGWTPTAFVSSRAIRAQMAPRRAEDFMDEEDDPLLGKQLELSETFDTLHHNEKARRVEAAAATESRRPLFQVSDELILPTTHDSVGKKLLNRMGWKDGHGIGPRMRRRKLSIGSDNEETKAENHKDSDQEEVYVPPRNTVDARVFPKPKTDKYGAGFDPYVDAPEFLRHKLRQEQDSEQQKPHRQVVTFAQALGNTNARIGNSTTRVSMGFGLSALEENDDLDVYGTTSMDDFDRAIAPASESIKLLDSMTSYARDEKRRDDGQLTGKLCFDGRPALRGFRIASKKQKPPEHVIDRLHVPSDFRAYHVFNESEEGAAVATVYGKFNFSTEKGGRGSTMTAKQRAQMLQGEDAVDKPTTMVESDKPQAGSVFDLLDPAQRETLMGAAQAARERKSPVPQGAPTEQFRANIMASISKRFVSASTTENASTNSENATASVMKEKKSFRSEDAWAPHVLLCKRFRVKCNGPTISGGTQSDDITPDLFTTELAPHLVDLAASRRSATNLSSDATAPSATAHPKRQQDQEAELPPLPNVPKPSTDLLRSIFEPSDASDIDDDDDDEDDRESNSDAGESRQNADNLPAIASTKADRVLQPVEDVFLSREEKPTGVASLSGDSDSLEDSDSDGDLDRHAKKHKSSKTKKIKKYRKLDDDTDRKRKHKKKSSRKADGSSRKSMKKTTKKKKKHSEERESERSSRRARSRSRSRSRSRDRDRSRRG